MNAVKLADLTAGLYLVATPIGNLRDITLRALDVLKQADYIACEDKRVTGKLLQSYDIENNGRLLVYNDHSKAGDRQHIAALIGQGCSVALVSDAGMPMISDPGYKLVRDCIDLGLSVTSAPGANAPLAALQLSGLPSDRFMFAGFLPSKDQARFEIFNELKSVEATLVFYETAPRLQASLEAILATLGDRPVAVVREITKMFEEARRDTVSRLIAHYKEKGAPKGEIVLLIAGAEKTDYSDAQIEAMLRDALETMSSKDASAFVAEQTGLPRKQLYNLVLSMKDA